MTFEEHVQWARGRAHQYADDGLGALAVSSLLSDFTKHPQTAPGIQGCMVAVIPVDDRDPHQVRRWIDGCFPSVPVAPRKAGRHG